MDSAHSQTPAGEPAPDPAADAVTRIREAAKTLFARSGYDAVSISAIASRAGVSKANVFHHFSSKKELYLAVVRAACRDSAQRLQNLGDQRGPFKQRFTAFAAAMLSDMLAEKPVQKLILRELLKDGEQHGRDLAEKVFGENFANLVRILRDGQRRGELRDDLDPAMLATLLIGANVFFFEAQEVLRHFPDVGFAQDPARYSELLADILLRGTATKNARAPAIQAQPARSSQENE